MNGYIKKLKEQDDFMTLGGVTEKDIDDAERTLGLRFAKEYHNYLIECGIATAIGHEFTGIGKTQRLNVVNVTKEQRSRNPNVSDDLYVIEELGIDGIVIWQSESGEVYQTVSELKPEKIAKSLEEYVGDMFV